jgi:hypothetical protein
VAGTSATAGLPTVHPFSTLGVRSFSPFGRGRFDERFLRREEFIIRGDHRAAETLGREVGEIDEHEGRGGETGRELQELH